MMPPMITMTADESRLGWGELVEAVTAPVGGDHVQITRSRGRAADPAQATKTVAVVVSIDWYDALPADQLPSEANVRTMTSPVLRANLREALDNALAGVHTKMTRHGKVVAVLVPHTWYEEVGQAGRE
jgi:hypothetical protein